MAQSVGIIGAGILGRLVALGAGEAGFETTLFDRDSRDGHKSCSWVGAGMTAPFTELDKAEPVIAAMGMRSLELWPQILGKLSQPVFFQQAGSLVVAHRQDLGDLEMFKSRIRPKLDRPERMQELDAPSVAQLEPELANRFQRGVFFPDEAQLEPRDLLPALEEALLAANVTWIQNTEVTKIEPCRVVAGEEERRFDWVVDARGLAARDQLKNLRGVRGELARLHAPEVNLNRLVRLMHPRYPLYIAPRANHVFIIGATSIESEDMKGVTVKSGLELLSALYSLHPGFAEAEILELAVQCRPAFPDNLPQLNMEPGLITANGLYRHGYLIGPALAEKVIQSMVDEKAAALGGVTC